MIFSLELFYLLETRKTFDIPGQIKGVGMVDFFSLEKVLETNLIVTIYQESRNRCHGSKRLRDGLFSSKDQV